MYRWIALYLHYRYILVDNKIVIGRYNYDWLVGHLYTTRLSRLPIEAETFKSTEANQYYENLNTYFYLFIFNSFTLHLFLRGLLLSNFQKIDFFLRKHVP